MKQHKQKIFLHQQRTSTYRDTTPLTTHASQTLRGPAGLLAGYTFGVWRQVPFPPVVILHNVSLEIGLKHYLGKKDKLYSFEAFFNPSFMLMQRSIFSIKLNLNEFTKAK